MPCHLGTAAPPPASLDQEKMTRGDDSLVAEQVRRLHSPLRDTRELSWAANLPDEAAKTAFPPVAHYLSLPQERALSTFFFFFPSQKEDKLHQAIFISFAEVSDERGQQN